MLENIEVLYHSSIKINKEKIIYIDPFKIDREYKDADIIFITHDHYDHYSEADIDKVRKGNTKIIVPESLQSKLLIRGIKEENIITVEPNEQDDIDDIKFETKGFECKGCSNNCVIVKIFKDNKLIDSFGNRCDKTINVK